MSVRGPNNVGRAVQTDPTLLRYASAITEQKKCWELLAEKFERFQTLRNNTQQHPTRCANGRNMYHPTMLGVVGQQCCVRLHGALGALQSNDAMTAKTKVNLLSSSLHRDYSYPFTLSKVCEPLWS